MDKELRDLIYQTIDNTISPSDFDRLQDAMLGNVELQQEYLRAVNVCEILSDPSTLQSETLAVTLPERPSVLSRVVGMRRTFIKAALVAAATLLVTLTLQSYVGIQARVASPIAVSSVINQQPVVHRGLARIVQRVDCVLEVEKWGATTSEEFHPGESIAISQGLLAVEFNNGVVVTLEGPAELEIVTAESAFLHTGKLSALVPESAYGFEIITPSAHCLADGKEFGVSVDGTGNTEAHVFDGEVELVPTRSIVGRSNGTVESDDRLTQGFRMRALMAAQVPSRRVRLDEPWFVTIPADRSRFVRIPGRDDEVRSDIPVTNLPLTDDLILWFEASQGVQRDNQSRVISWSNLADRSSEDLGSQKSQPAAWQVNPSQRPLWKPHTYPVLRHPHGWPSIQFGGRKNEEFLVTSPVEVGDDFTAFVIASLRFGKGGTLLKLQGQSSFRISQTLSQPKFVASSTTTKNDKASSYQRSAIKGESNLPDMLVLCAVQYSHQNNTFDLYVDGRLQGSATPLGSPPKKGTHIFGAGGSGDRFFFSGNIAELIVYNHMLDAAHFQDATDALLEKYELSTR
ncbi:LamG domain-containing protein [Aporhodopirellula aestuarii]|uniref:LamG domain-containing protein n=1 Tax=Aporhodopirellula aestuarii TaxID=2950107 RepID=A0ABT0U9A7_9BACT|nr:LamG domain-containing protein [Aporhodopirellula aestuarii]MCM2373558.1 LamG domain-containing protein [Aporhodopirellula aestuarii]